MDWTGIIQQLISMGLPVLGTALGGPAGGAVASLIAQALSKLTGAPVEATPGAIGNILATTDKDVAIQQLKSIEAQFVEQVHADAEISKVAIQAINESWRAELGDAKTGWFASFQKGWRPLFAYELILECMGGAVLVIHEFWTGDMATINAMLPFQGLLIWYYGLRFAVLGVYVGGRSAEKISMSQIPGGPTPDLVDTVVKKVRAVLKK